MFLPLRGSTAIQMFSILCLTLSWSFSFSFKTLGSEDTALNHLLQLQYKEAQVISDLQGMCAKTYKQPCCTALCTMPQQLLMLPNREIPHGHFTLLPLLVALA